MEAEALIAKILSAKVPREILTPEEYKKDFRRLAQIIHPDHCSLPNAKDAFDKLNNFKEIFENGITFTDGVCSINVKGNEVVYEGDIDLLKTSYKNYKILKAIADKSKSTFARYMPIKGEIMDGKLYFTTEEDAIVVSSQTLIEEHVRWILRRLLSYAAWLEKEGFVHAGINPESFCIARNHGIYITSFYHVTKAQGKLKTVSGKYLSWYNPTALKEKIAVNSIDLTLLKKSAIYLLGDKTGVGTPLKRKGKVHEQLIEYLLKFEDNVFKSFDSYNELVEKVFGVNYHELKM